MEWLILTFMVLAPIVVVWWWKDRSQTKQLTSATLRWDVSGSTVADVVSQLRVGILVDNGTSVGGVTKLIHDDGDSSSHTLIYAGRTPLQDHWQAGVSVDEDGSRVIVEFAVLKWLTRDGANEMSHQLAALRDDVVETLKLLDPAATVQETPV